MKSKTHEQNTFIGNNFLLILTILFFSLTAVKNAEDFEGNFSITIPGNRLLKSIKLGVELPQTQKVLVTQNQSNNSPDSMVQVGKLSRITVKRNRKGKLRYKDSLQSSVQAVFFLYDNIQVLDTFSIKPKFYSKNDEFHSRGSTDKVFILEFLEVDRVGEFKGKLLKKIQSIALDIGKENRFNLGLKPSSGKKIAVKLYTQGSDQHFLHFPAKKQGKYPFDLLDLKTDLVKRWYSAPISFSYIHSKSLNVDRSESSVFHQLASQVNHFVKSHSDYGSNTIIEVPIKLQMKLEKMNEAQKIRALIGPSSNVNLYKDNESTAN